MPVRYEGAESVSELKRFVTAETAIWIGLKGTLEKFDKIAQDFTAGAVSLDAAKARMGTELEALQDEDSQNTAKMSVVCACYPSLLIFSVPKGCEHGLALDPAVDWHVGLHPQIHDRHGPYWEESRRGNRSRRRGQGLNRV